MSSGVAAAACMGPAHLLAKTRRHLVQEEAHVDAHAEEVERRGRSEEGRVGKGRREA